MNNPLNNNNMEQEVIEEGHPEAHTTFHAITNSNVIQGGSQVHAGTCDCEECNFQSPFHIQSDVVEPLPEGLSIDIRFAPTPFKPEIKQDARSKRYNLVKVPGSPESTLLIRNGHTHFVGHLDDFHMHFPAEHVIDNERYDGELHFVFKNEEGKCAVAGVLIKEGTHDNPLVDRMLKKLAPKHEDSFFEKIGHVFQSAMEWVFGMAHKDPRDEAIDYRHLVPKKPEIFYTHGSTTMPGPDGTFMEDTQWILFKEPITMSKEQIKALTRSIGSTNNRPLQADDDRTIYEGAVARVTQRIPMVPGF